MSINVGFLLISVVKIVAVLAWVYGLLWALGRDSLATKCEDILIFRSFHSCDFKRLNLA